MLDALTHQHLVEWIPVQVGQLGELESGGLGEGLEGRLRSCSYAPPMEHSNHRPMMEELRCIFAAHEEGGRVTLDYDCRIYYGQLA